MDNDVLAYRVLLEKRKENAPFWEKKVLTVEEAAEYTGIGRTKIRQIIMKGDCPFAVTNGVQVCVIRDKFIDYLDKQFRIKKGGNYAKNKKKRQIKSSASYRRITESRWYIPFQLDGRQPQKALCVCQDT